MKKRILSLVVVGVFGTSLLAGCGSKSETAEKANEEEEIIEEEVAVVETDAEDSADAEDSNEVGDIDEEISEDVAEETEIENDSGIDISGITDADIESAEIQMTLACAIQDEAYLEGFPERVYAYSDGQIGITYISLDSLGTSDDAVEMLKNGSISMYYNSAAQTPGSFPVSDVFTVPYLFKSGEQQNQAVYDLYDAGYLTEYDDQMKVLWFSNTDPQMLVFASDEPKTVDDMKGLQIRATSGLSIDMIENLGASVVSMGFSDVYLSLDRGVVDGAMSSPVMMATNSWQDVAKYLMDEEFFWGVELCAINLDLYNSLSDDLQNAILDASAEQYEYNMASVDDAGNSNLQIMIDAGVELYEVEDELRNAFEEQSELLKQEQINVLTENGFDGEAIMQVIDESMAANPVD